jgi:uroporphyrinogen decarboxylase
MTAREQALCALKHQTPERTPWQIETTRGFARKLRDRIGRADVEAYLGNHLARVKYKENEILPDGNEVDLFGVTWGKADDGGDIGIVVDYPMKEASFDNYTMPEVRQALASEVCDQLENEKDCRFSLFSLGMSFFERAWSLRGMENILMDMASDEKFTHDLFARIEAHHMELLNRVLDRRFDAFYIGDDWGQQRGLIMGPPMWRKYIKPAMARLFERIKSKGKKVCLHSCGDLREIFPDLVDMGLDIYNTLQPEIYDFAEMKREYGKDIAFYGGISVQQFLPYATPREVKDKCLETCRILGENGGYILAPTHAVTPDIPVENVLAIIEAAKETAQ